jgi:hypothetical protein
MKSIKIISTTGKDQFQKTVSMSLKPPTKIDMHKSFDENDLTNKSVTRRISLSSIRIPAYTVADLQIATGSFSPENFISEGSFGRVFKAQFDDHKVLPKLLETHNFQDSSLHYIYGTSIIRIHI